MPYDDYAKMKAEMLMKQDAPIYDDGASQLGTDPFMHPVGLFGKGRPRPVYVPPIDIQRRSILGLKPQAPLPENLPAVRSSDVPVPAAVPVPQAPVQAPPVPENPLNQMANKALNAPVTRRDVIKKAGQAAINQMMPAQAASPLVEAAKTIVPKTLSRAASIFPAMDEAVRGYMLNALSEQLNAGDWGAESAYRFYDEVRPDLVGKIPDKDLQRLDKLSEKIQDKYFDFVNSEDPEESGEFQKAHYNNLNKFTDLLEKHAHHIPVNKFLGGSEFTENAADPEYIKEDLQNIEEFSPEHIDEYIKSLKERLNP